MLKKLSITKKTISKPNLSIFLFILNSILALSSISPVPRNLRIAEKDTYILPLEDYFQGTDIYYEIEGDNPGIQLKGNWAAEKLIKFNKDCKVLDFRPIGKEYFAMS